MRKKRNDWGRQSSSNQLAVQAGTVVVIETGLRTSNVFQCYLLSDAVNLVMTASRGRRRTLAMERLARMGHLADILNSAQFDKTIAAEIG